MRILLRALAFFGFATAVATGAGAATFYTDNGSYQAASTGNAIFDFEGVAAPGGFVVVGGAYTRGPVQFVSSGAAFVIDQGAPTFGFYGRDFYSNQGTALTTLNLSGATAFAFDFGGYNDAGEAITFTLSDGSSFGTTIPSRGSSAFLGFTSQIGIASVLISNSGAQTTDILGFQVGNSAAVPEPATWAMLILGFGVVGGALRRRKGRGLAPAPRTA